MHAHFAVVDQAVLAFMDELDRVFDGDDVVARFLLQ
jgi:translation initiation factor 2B subunit (eIF-2B alpha/beta/delta family)